ncbi:unnamed protein product [Urochloa humidicola]
MFSSRIVGCITGWYANDQLTLDITFNSITSLMNASLMPPSLRIQEWGNCRYDLRLWFNSVSWPRLHSVVVLLRHFESYRKQWNSVTLHLGGAESQLAAFTVRQDESLPSLDRAGTIQASPKASLNVRMLMHPTKGEYILCQNDNSWPCLYQNNFGYSLLECMETMSVMIIHMYNDL